MKCCPNNIHGVVHVTAVCENTSPSLYYIGCTPRKVYRIMKKTSVDDIADNSILAKDVYGNAGNVLLGKGTSLSAAMGRRLKNWGIPFVWIEGDEDAAENTESTEVDTEDVIAKLDERFAGLLDNPIMSAIHTAVRDFRSGKGAL